MPNTRSPFPEKAEEQQLFWKLYRGFIKELISGSQQDYNEPILTIGEKYFCKKGEKFIFKEISFSEEDKRKINSQNNSQNTCSYLLYDRIKIILLNSIIKILS